MVVAILNLLIPLPEFRIMNSYLNYKMGARLGEVIAV